MTTPEEGLEKAALLLMTLGPDAAAGVLRQLGPREVQKLTMKMASMTPQSRETVEPVLIEVNEHFGKGSMIQSDDDQLRELLTKALGDDRANQLLSRMMSGSETAGIESLKWMDAATAADLIKGEHPQIIATILVHLEYDQAGEILTPEAYILNRMRGAWKGLFLLVILGPLLISVVARTLGWALLFGGKNGVANIALMKLGVIDAPLSFMFTEAGVVIALAHVLMPFMVLSVWAALQKLDPQIENAALALGASQTTVVRRIILPQIMPGLLSGGIIVFSLAASAFATPAIIGGRRLGRGDAGL